MSNIPFDIEIENLRIRKMELELDVKRITDNLTNIESETKITLAKLRKDIDGAKQAGERSKERYFATLETKEGELEEVKLKLKEKEKGDK
jgi:CO dehydrogenase/acetyl-CoA synthase delta subunit